MNYDIASDIDSVLSLKGFNIDYFSLISGVPKRTIFYNYKIKPSNQFLEQIYSTIYDLGIRLSEAKSEILQEMTSNDEFIVYHGSKCGIENLSCNGSREECDFGRGLYLTKLFNSAKSFIETSSYSSIYAFSLSLKSLNILEFECDLDWMLAICFFRGKIKQYENLKLVNDIIEKVNKADMVIAPIADNKMFEIINKFANDEITTAEAMHALSASRLGKQYVIKTKRALDNLVFKDRFYMCSKEREDSLLLSKDRDNVIQTKLDYAKHKYRNEGKYISEILK